MDLKNKNTTKEKFNIACNIIKEKYPKFNTSNIIGIFAKRVSNADIISKNKNRNGSVDSTTIKTTTGKTSDIACTSQARSFFYPLLGSIAADNKHALEEVNVFPLNVETFYLTDTYDNDFINVNCAIWIKEKTNQQNQIGLSKKSLDGAEFRAFRENLVPNDTIIFFKYLNENNIIDIYVLMLKITIASDEAFIESLDIKERFPLYYELPNNGSEVSKPPVKSSNSNPNYISTAYKGINKIFFGAPGTGKSNLVNTKYYDVYYSKRVTFHPEYTYHDFVGSIKPCVNNGSFTYKFVPGIFTEILILSLNDTTHQYTLIIEELNRANAAAVFGDLFQLLDRNDVTGVSEYAIFNTELLDSINDNTSLNYSEIKIPNNLNIIATMNTADQNVFSMDTAFKRRWSVEYIPVIFGANHKFKDNLIPQLNISWENFAITVNTFMLSVENSDLMISEDKQLGPYFIKESELLDVNAFAYKVFLYLWDDVFRIERSRFFNPSIRCFSALIDTFNKTPLDVFCQTIQMNFKNLVLSTPIAKSED